MPIIDIYKNQADKDAVAEKQLAIAKLKAERADKETAFQTLAKAHYDWCVENSQAIEALEAEIRSIVEKKQ